MVFVLFLILNTKVNVPNCNNKLTNIKTPRIYKYNVISPKTISDIGDIHDFISDLTSSRFNAAKHCSTIILGIIINNAKNYI